MLKNLFKKREMSEHIPNGQLAQQYQKGFEQGYHDKIANLKYNPTGTDEESDGYEAGWDQADFELHQM